ncbi:hypothetical protein [Bradyrhizobium australiense]|uniref:hypothetical protein n=1 Tax=Bradyrhizobium australiense TaxID=2721161 RepID=UPI001F410F01|nr:hypothetical protein [Bradyrhizobium australiense]
MMPAVHRRQRPAQPVGVGRHQDQLRVVRHQAPRPDFHPGGAAGCGEHVAIERVIVLAKERARTAVAALRHVMRVAGNDDTGEAGHAPGSMVEGEKPIKCTVTVMDHEADPT